jgi:hypothetical protein
MIRRRLQFLRGAWNYVCFSPLREQVRAVSLNRCEQRLFDYLKGHPEERHYWLAKVPSIASQQPDDAAAAARLEAALWAYYAERSRVASPFREAAQAEGLQRTSMRNLAELLLRLWIAPRKKPQAAPTGGAAGADTLS